MSSLIDMMKQFKEKEANSREEIQKLTQLIGHKDEEISTLDVEISSLTDFLEKVRIEQKEKIKSCKK